MHALLCFLAIRGLICLGVVVALMYAKSDGTPGHEIIRTSITLGLGGWAAYLLTTGV